MLKLRIQEVVADVLKEHEEANLSSDVAKNMIAEDVALATYEELQNYLADFD